MSPSGSEIYFHQDLETAERDALAQHQWSRMRTLLDQVYHANAFYRAKWQTAGVDSPDAIQTLSEFRQLPFTTREELGADQEQNPPYGTNLTWPRDQYQFWHRTSGRKGSPLYSLSTRKDWQWYAETWCYNFSAVGLIPGDALYIAFSFGPFAGLWGAVAGAEAAGLMMIPGGGQSTRDRLHFILAYRPDVVICIPSYALRLAETAQELGLDLPQSGVKMLLHGGEPGPSIPATRARIEAGWGAPSYDTTGQTEVGHHGFECRQQDGVHMIESEYYVEVFAPGADQAIPEGQVGELVITALGRMGMPVIRYRTGDLVRLTRQTCACGRTFARLKGGILGRVDEMVTVRGINIFPTALEDCLLGFPAVAEYRVLIQNLRGMREIKVQVECSEAAYADDHGAALAISVAEELRRRLTIRIDVEPLAPDSLPRPQGKAYRVQVQEFEG